MAIIGVFQYVIMSEFIYQNKAVSIQEQMKAISPGVWDNLILNAKDSGQIIGDNKNNNFPMKPDRLPYFMTPDSTVAFVDAEGNYYVISNSTADGRTPPQLDLTTYENSSQFKYGRAYQIVNGGTNSEELVVLHPVFERGQRIGTVQVSMGTAPLKEILYHILIAFLSLSLLALIAGILAFIPVLRKTLVPLSKMAETVEQINSGNLAERFPVEQGQIEIDQLAGSFNRMLERLELSFKAEQEAKEQMRRFVADASHELRTPLTSIHGFLEVLLRGAVNQPDKLEKSLKSMLTESERMKKLIQDLLQLAKLDRTPQIELKEGRLDNLIKEMEPQLKMLAGLRKVTINLGSALRCRFDEDKIKQVILNLFQNAVQHTEAEEGRIELSLKDTANGVEIEVKDNGPGIAAKHLPYLFDRFYRCDSSRTRKHGGSGLGLSITRSIVELHGGTIKVATVEGKGTAFQVGLPLNKHSQ
nr:HAMP domain-containing sensor histidine kinase [Syntrophobotulus glycolicus]